jgi:hypothetical protein
MHDSRRDHQQNRGGYPSRGRGRGQFQEKPLYCMFHEKDIVHQTRDCPIFLDSKKKMAQKQNQPLASSSTKEAIHTSHWHQPSQSSSSNQPSHHNFSPRQEYQLNHHRYPSQYYRPYNYMTYTSQIHAPQPTITYPETPLQITYPAASSQTSQPKTKLNNPPPPPPPSQVSSQQTTSFPAFGTIRTNNGGSNLAFERKRQK